MSNKVNRIGNTLLQFLFIIIGGTFELSFKVLTNLKDKASEKLEYDHLYFLIFVYFLSEFICIIPYFLRRRRRSTINSIDSENENENENEEDTAKKSFSSGSEEFINEIKDTIIEKPLSKKVNLLYYLFPTLFDALSKILFGIGIKDQTVDFTSISNILVVIIAGIYSKVIRAKRFTSYSIIGLILFLLSLSSFIVVDCIENGLFQSGTFSKVVNWVCLCIGEVMQLIQFYLQENNLKNLGVTCLQEVGMEGLCGTIIFGILLVCLQYIDCTSSKLVQRNLCWGSKVENSVEAFKGIANTPVIYFFIIYAALGVFYSLFSVILIKRTQTIIRVIIDICNILIPFVFYIILSSSIVNLETKKWSNYYIPGLICAFLSTLIFVEVIKLPYSRKIDDLNNNYVINRNMKDEFISQAIIP